MKPLLRVVVLFATFTISVGVGRYVIPKRPAPTAINRAETPAIQKPSKPRSAAPLVNAMREARKVKSLPQRRALVLALASKATATDFPRLLDEAINDERNLALLAARWAEVDPAGLLQWIETNFTEPREFGKIHGVLRNLFRVWVSKDWRAARTAFALFSAPSLKPLVFDSMLFAMLHHDMKLGVEVMALEGPPRTGWGVEAWMDADPARAAELLKSIQSSRWRSMLMARAVEKISLTDPNAAIDVLCDLGRTQGIHNRFLSLRSVAENALRLGVADSISNRVTALPTNLRYEWPRALGSVLASKDPERAIEYAEQNLSGPAKKNVMVPAFFLFAGRNPSAAAARAEALPPGPIRDAVIEVVQKSTVR